MKIYLSIFAIISSLLMPHMAHSQEPTVLDIYIEEGLKENLALQQKNISLEKALSSLQEAKSLFLPKVDFSAGYLSGKGGRYIDIPVGDMLNPVYRSLNFLMQTDQFPQIENVKQNFFPNNQTDIRVRTSLPLYNSDIIHNRNIQEQQHFLKTIEIDTYKRELVLQIKQAYFQYLMALENAAIYKEAQQLVDRNVQVNESLLKNGKGLHASVLRAKTEQENVTAQYNTAIIQSENAKAYFNFLLNKPLDSEILNSYDSKSALNTILGQESNPTTDQREELKMILAGKDIYETKYKMQKQFFTPKISAFADLGSQNEKFKFQKTSLYYLIGVQVDMPLFNRPQKYKLQQTQIDVRLTENQYEQAKQQLNLGLNVAQNDMQSAITNYRQAIKQQENAASYFRLIERGFQEGIHSLIEYIDARNQLTVTQTLLNIHTYKVLQTAASVERQAATFPIQH